MHLLGVAVAGLAARLAVVVVSACVSLRRKDGVSNLPGASRKLRKR